MLRKSIFAFAAALLSVASATAIANTAVHQGKPRCGDICTFYFCKADGRRTVFEDVGPRLIVRDPNVATHPFVCRKIVTDPSNFLNQTVKVRKTGEAEVHPAEDRGQSPRPFVPISKYSPAGLSKKFSKKYFSLREINRFPPIPGESGISRLPSRGNQEDFVDDLCVLLPVKAYDLFKESGSLDRRVKRTNQREDCLSFRTTAPRILIELTWDSSDDLDVSVEEPDGNVVSFRKPNSPNGGRLILDQNVARCGEDPDGREQVRWGRDGNPKKGSYEVTIKHFNNCGGKATKWSLAVVIDGKLKLFKNGKSNRDNNKRITRTSFTF